MRRRQKRSARPCCSIFPRPFPSKLARAKHHKLALPTSNTTITGQRCRFETTAAKHGPPVSRTVSTSLCSSPVILLPDLHPHPCRRCLHSPLRRPSNRHRTHPRTLLGDQGPRLAKADWELNNGHAFRGVDTDVMWTKDQSATPQCSSRDAMPPLHAALQALVEGFCFLPHSCPPEVAAASRRLRG